MNSSNNNHIYDITFFVPCYNEEDNVTKTLSSIYSAASNKAKLTYEIIIVDDKSTDSTGMKAREFSDQHPNLKITLIENKINLGLGRNYIDISFVAKGKYYMLVNGDNAEPEETILAIINEIGKADMIIPYFGPHDILSGYNIKYYNGPVAHKRFNVRRWSPDTHGYAYQAELIVKILEEGGTYLEVKINNNDREQGLSKAFKIQNIFSVAHSILQIFLRRLRKLLFYRNV